MYPCINRGNRDRKFHLRIKGSLGSKQKLASYQIPREKNAVENFPAPLLPGGRVGYNMFRVPSSLLPYP